MFSSSTSKLMAGCGGGLEIVSPLFVSLLGGRLVRPHRRGPGGRFVRPRHLPLCRLGPKHSAQSSCTSTVWRRQNSAEAPQTGATLVSSSSHEVDQASIEDPSSHFVPFALVEPHCLVELYVGVQHRLQTVAVVGPTGSPPAGFVVRATALVTLGLEHH